MTTFFYVLTHIASFLCGFALGAIIGVAFFMSLLNHMHKGSTIDVSEILDDEPAN